MEVHHHPDLHHKRKHIKEYFLEFIMIFLAVTLGFFAESLRENIGNKEKEKDYISSFIKNLEDDTTAFKNTIEANQEKLNKLEKVMSLSFMQLPDPASRKLFYIYCTGKSIGFYSVFKSNDATMLQLKNSSGLQVIRKDHVADSIARYDNEVKYVYAAETMYWNATDLAILATHELLDYRVFYDTTYFNNNQFTDKPLPPVTDDPQKLKLFFNKVDLEIGSTRNYIYNLQRRLPYAIHLIGFLKKEYEIE